MSASVLESVSPKNKTKASSSSRSNLPTRKTQHGHPVTLDGLVALGRRQTETRLLFFCKSRCTPPGTAFFSFLFNIPSKIMLGYRSMLGERFCTHVYTSISDPYVYMYVHTSLDETTESALGGHAWRRHSCAALVAPLNKQHHLAATHHITRPYGPIHWEQRRKSTLRQRGSRTPGAQLVPRESSTPSGLESFATVTSVGVSWGHEGALFEDVVSCTVTGGESSAAVGNAAALSGTGASCT